MKNVEERPRATKAGAGSGVVAQGLHYGYRGSKTDIRIYIKLLQRFYQLLGLQGSASSDACIYPLNDPTLADYAVVRHFVCFQGRM
jgi:hypothetical protein